MSFAYARKSAYSKEFQENDEEFKSRSAISKIGRRLAGMMKSEVTMCAEQRLHQDNENARVPPIAVVGNVLAGCGGYVRLVFGTIIFSSILFVSVWDALNHILTRYIISVIVCGLILVIKVADLRVRGETKYLLLLGTKHQKVVRDAHGWLVSGPLQVSPKIHPS